MITHSPSNAASPILPTGAAIEEKPLRCSDLGTKRCRSAADRADLGKRLGLPTRSLGDFSYTLRSA
jgi:hypothetical protein